MSVVTALRGVRHRIGRPAAYWRDAPRHFSAVAVERNNGFKRVTEEDVSYFKSVMADGGVLTDREDVFGFNQDWMGKYQGEGSVVLRPRSATEVSQILKYCNEKRIAVVPQGGNTGLVGGSVPVHDEIVLSLSLMNKVLDFDDISGTLVCEAGCVLEALDGHLKEKGYMMPLDLGAKGSCQIGGNVSTNAGGIRFLRYGSLHGNVLGIEAVLADGTILNNMSTLRKDNTGYDLKQLFIGSEGTLGVVTGVTLNVPRRPQSVQTILLANNSYEDVQSTLKLARENLSEILSAFEFFDGDCMRLSTTHLDDARNPLEGIQPFYTLIEVAGSNEDHDMEKLNIFLEKAMEGPATDGTIAQSSTQASEFWRLREGLAEALRKAGAVYKYDISLPVDRLYDLVEATREQLSGTEALVYGYGHVGDGNLHLNINTPEYSDKYLSLIEPFVYEWTEKVDGSISAEHGLGVMKADHIHYSKSPEMVHLMKTFKNVMDPNGILNPYKVLPA